MQVIKTHRVIFVDVDDTLVIWDWKEFDPEGKTLVSIENPEANCTELVMPHNRHVQLIRQFKARGHTIVVWSQGGWSWAESVVKTLGIENLVDFVMDKPNWYIDDLPAEAFMRLPIYLHPTDKTKDKRWGIPDEEDK